MVIGNGLISKAFHKYNGDNNIIIFASGVSNSKETRPQIFNREKLLLLNTISSHDHMKLVYFSTCSIYDSEKKDSKYVKHKLEMESLIKERCKQYHIFRLSQVVGRSNSPTLINYLFDSISNKKCMNISLNTSRNLISIYDVYLIADEIIKKRLYLNQAINIASGFDTSVIKIIEYIEKILDTKAIYNLQNNGTTFKIDINKIKQLRSASEICRDGYIKDILIKYKKECK